MGPRRSGEDGFPIGDRSCSLPRHRHEDGAWPSRGAQIGAPVDAPQPCPRSRPDVLCRERDHDALRGDQRSGNYLAAQIGALPAALRRLPRRRRADPLSRNTLGRPNRHAATAPEVAISRPLARLQIDGPQAHIGHSRRAPATGDCGRAQEAAGCVKSRSQGEGASDRPGPMRTSPPERPVTRRCPGRRSANRRHARETGSRRRCAHAPATTPPWRPPQHTPR